MNAAHQKLYSICVSIGFVSFPPVLLFVHVSFSSSNWGLSHNRCPEHSDRAALSWALPTGCPNINKHRETPHMPARRGDRKTRERQRINPEKDEKRGSNNRQKARDGYCCWGQSQRTTPPEPHDWVLNYMCTSASVWGWHLPRLSEVWPLRPVALRSLCLQGLEHNDVLFLKVTSKTAWRKKVQHDWDLRWSVKHYRGICMSPKCWPEPAACHFSSNSSSLFYCCFL